MRIIGVLFSILFLCSVANARDVQLLNPEFFGRPTSMAVKLLYDKKTDEIEPYMVTTDIKCGKYHAASVFYGEKVTFAEVRASLNKLYGSYEDVSLLKESLQAIWVVKDKRFGIHLVQEVEDVVRVMYIQWRPMKKVTKDTTKAGGTIFEDDECKE
ncbi:MAG TPA: hypothetical protein VEF33_02880 [Syntrophales bacterium]|nr:hypothetical protein [Syntrophales bacterium]